MRTTAIGLIAAIAVLAISAAGQAQKQAVPPQPQTGQGRYQVVPTNDDFYKVILLDTFTGNTWTVCFLDSPTDASIKVKSWCALERADAHGTIKKPGSK